MCPRLAPQPRQAMTVVKESITELESESGVGGAVGTMGDDSEDDDDGAAGGEERKSAEAAPAVVAQGLGALRLAQAALKVAVAGVTDLAKRARGDTTEPVPPSMAPAPAATTPAAGTDTEPSTTGGATVAAGEPAGGADGMDGPPPTTAASDRLAKLAEAVEDAVIDFADALNDPEVRRRRRRWQHGRDVG
jgi:hypothetical protein